MTLVREDWVARTSGVPVVALAAAPGSYVLNGETLKAYKRETLLKIRLRLRSLRDEKVDRRQVEGP